MASPRSTPSRRRHTRPIVILTGAGISASAGIATFRGANGLWAGHAIEEVASPEGWRRDPALVRRFYDQRRMQLADVEPTAAHRALADLERHARVVIITQNVDDLHERAGSTTVIHLHGELTKLRAEDDPDIIVEIGYTAQDPDQRGPAGQKLRPHIVWFGEYVSAIHWASEITGRARAFWIIGTSLNVYPAAGLWRLVPEDCAVTYVDPDASADPQQRITIVKSMADHAVPAMVQNVLKHSG